jgi:hypothetical protein
MDALATVMLPKNQVLPKDPFSYDNLHKHLMEIKRTSSPGFPDGANGFSTNGQVIDKLGSKYIIDKVLAKINRMLSHFEATGFNGAYEDFFDKNPIDWKEELGAADTIMEPIRTFVKCEPTTYKKISTDTGRIISSVSLYDALLARALYSHSTTKQIGNYGKLPIKIGMSPFNGTAGNFVREYSPGKLNAKGLYVSTDKSKQDFRQPRPMFELLAEHYTNITIPSTGYNHDEIMKDPTLDKDYYLWFRVHSVHFKALSKCLFITSRGYIYEQIDGGMIKSGHFLTLDMNSVAQLIICFMRRFRDHASCDGNLLSLGDDLIEEIHDVSEVSSILEFNNSIGITTTCEATPGPIDQQEFCSSKFQYNDILGDYHFETTNFKKMLHNLSFETPNTTPQQTAGKIESLYLTNYFNADHRLLFVKLANYHNSKYDDPLLHVKLMPFPQVKKLYTVPVGFVQQSALAKSNSVVVLKNISLAQSKPIASPLPFTFFYSLFCPLFFLPLFFFMSLDKLIDSAITTVDHMEKRRNPIRSMVKHFKKASVKGSVKMKRPNPAKKKIQDVLKVAEREESTLGVRSIAEKNKHHQVVRTVNPDGSISLKKREYIGDINSSATFTTQLSQVVNPTNQILFPWLSTQAGSYDEYKFRRLVFIYEGRCPNNTPGQALAAFDYDLSDSPPVSKLSMNNFSDDSRINTDVYSTSARMTLPIRKLNKLKVYSTRGPSDTSNIPDVAHDVGQVFFATTNGPTSSVFIGEIWVEYDILLSSPQVNLASNTAFEMYLPVGGSVTYSSAIAFPGTPFVSVASNVIGYTPGAITFQAPGRYWFSLEYINTGTTPFSTVLPFAGIGVSSSITVISDWLGSSGAQGVNSSATTVVTNFLITVNTVPSAITISLNAGMVTACNSSFSAGYLVRVVGIPNNNSLKLAAHGINLLGTKPSNSTNQQLNLREAAGFDEKFPLSTDSTPIHVEVPTPPHSPQFYPISSYPVLNVPIKNRVTKP